MAGNDKTLGDLPEFTGILADDDQLLVRRISVPQTVRVKKDIARNAIFSEAGSQKLDLTATDFDATVNIRGNGGSAGHAALAPNSADPDTGLKATVANELRVVAGDVDTLIVKTAEVLGANNVNLKLAGTGEYLYATARTGRKMYISANAFMFNGVEWILNNSGSAGCNIVHSTVAKAATWLDLGPFLRTGQIITLIRALVNPATSEGTVANRMHVRLLRHTHDYVTPNVSTNTTVFDVNDSGTAGLQVVTSGAISETIDKTTKSYSVCVSGCNTVAADAFQSIEITVTDPGPYNT